MEATIRRDLKKLSDDGCEIGERSTEETDEYVVVKHAIRVPPDSKWGKRWSERKGTEE